MWRPTCPKKNRDGTDGRAGSLGPDAKLMHRKGGESGMKKTMSREALVKESALWERMKEPVAKRPATVCHK